MRSSHLILLILTAVIALSVVLGTTVTYFAAGPSKTITQTQTATITVTTEQSSSEIRCSRVGEAFAFYVHVVSDVSRAPISGADVRVVSYDPCGARNGSSNAVTPSKKPPGKNRTFPIRHRTSSAPRPRRNRRPCC